MKVLIIWILSGLAVSGSVTVNCTFGFSWASEYTCNFSKTTISDNEHQIINFNGQHASGQDNRSVRRAESTSSNIPFIIFQFFTTFRNLSAFSHSSDNGLRRVQWGAFANANNLTNLWIVNNRHLTTIEEYAFTGASSLFDISLDHNSIETIHETAFSGLVNLFYLKLDFNKISYLSPILFKDLTSIYQINLNHNSLTALDGNLFANSPRITNLFFDENQINSIGRDLVENLQHYTSTTQLYLQNNVCIDGAWIINWSLSGEIDKERIRRGLSVCFDNADNTKAVNASRKSRLLSVLENNLEDFEQVGIEDLIQNLEI